LSSPRAPRGSIRAAAATLTSRLFDRAVEAHAALRRRAARTYRVIARRSGEHAFRRVDAQRAVERAIRTRRPGLRPVDDGADAEFWLSIVGRVALVGLRLSSGEMRLPRRLAAGGPRARPASAAQQEGHARGRSAFVSLPAALKPSVARAMVWLSQPRPDDAALDPLCGAGTLLLERAAAGPYRSLVGGDLDPTAVAAARANARHAGVRLDVRVWDALALPLPDASVDVVLTNPPFGKRVEIPGGDARAFYRGLVGEFTRVLRPHGRLVLLTSQADAFLQATRAVPLRLDRRVPIVLRGEPATIFVAQKRPD
jgi:tRNA (guanine6-N2)-methyltransferase